jgi:signal transduction histidine kinase
VIAGARRSLTPSSRLGRNRRSARLRLTLAYAGMFLVLGTALIVLTYVLTSTGPTVSVSPVPNPASASGIHNPVVAQRSADLNRLLGVSWLVLAITALGSGLLGWFASGRVLRPLQQMTETARTISAGNLSERLALTGPDDEFKRLGDTLDDLLARLEAAFEAQRRFVANASHELRTPLTLDRTLVEVALADPHASAGALRTTCEELLASGRNQELLLEALLTLASSERGLDDRAPLDLAGLAARMVRASLPDAERRSLHLTTMLLPAPTTGDQALIERLIGNLVENAVENNEPGGRVDIRTSTDDRQALVSVTNTGPVVPPEQLERLFEPFQRLDERRISTDDQHHGLGLSIVRAIAAAHGAILTAQPQPGGGLSVTVGFPGAGG